MVKGVLMTLLKRFYRCMGWHKPRTEQPMDALEFKTNLRTLMWPESNWRGSEHPSTKAWRYEATLAYINADEQTKLLVSNGRWVYQSNHKPLWRGGSSPRVRGRYADRVFIRSQNPRQSYLYPSHTWVD